MSQRWKIALLMFWLAVQSAVAEPIRLVTGDNLSPYTGRSLPLGGMLTEIVQRAFAASGKETTLAWTSWKRGYELTRVGEYDATFPYARLPEREKFYLFSALLYGGVRSVFARPEMNIDPARVDSFRGLTYCAPTGFIIYPQINALYQEHAIRMERPPSLVACAKMLALGRVDFYIADALSGDEALRQAGVGAKVVRLAKPFDRAEFYLIVPKNRAGADMLIADFNAGLKRLKDGGEYERILKRHLH